MKIIIHITKEVLKKTKFCLSGTEGTSKNCAIAYAVRELFPHADVNFNRISFYGTNKFEDSDHRRMTYLPLEAHNFINRFDSSTPEQRVSMDPFSFEIEVPENVIDRIGIDEVRKILSKSTTLSEVS